MQGGVIKDELIIGSAKIFFVTCWKTLRLEKCIITSAQKWLRGVAAKYENSKEVLICQAEFAAV